MKFDNQILALIEFAIKMGIDLIELASAIVKINNMSAEERKAFILSQRQMIIDEFERIEGH